MLNYFKICFANADPDLIIGHEVISSFLELLYSSLKNKGIDTFFLGRFNNFKFFSKDKIQSFNFIVKKIMNG